MSKVPRLLKESPLFGGIQVMVACLEYGFYPLNSVFLAATPEGGLVDTQDIGGFLKGFSRGQYSSNMLLFDFL
jgi:hypothetical protein